MNRGKTARGPWVQEPDCNVGFVTSAHVPSRSGSCPQLTYFHRDLFRSGFL